jgi:pimeloyl-ACP methyl ester carboxylesterase
MSTPYLRQVTAHRGCTLSWFADGSGPPVVMVQGVGVGATGWRPQAEALSAHFHCLCFDNRGFGASHAPDGELSVELMAEDMLALMDATGTSPS